MTRKNKGMKPIGPPEPLTAEAIERRAIGNILIRFATDDYYSRERATNDLLALIRQSTKDCIGKQI